MVNLRRSCLRHLMSSPQFWPSILVLLLMLGCGTRQQEDVVEILMEKHSPDGAFVATVFTCSGGGAAGYTYENVNLRLQSQALDPRLCLMGEHVTWHSFRQIQIKWVGPRHLEVSYEEDSSPAYRENNQRKITSLLGVRIDYIPLAHELLPP
jgi:hypothetical protein